MKILLVHKFLYPKGGAETYVLKLGAFLQEQGVDHKYVESAGVHDMKFWNEYTTPIIEWMFGEE